MVTKIFLLLTLLSSLGGLSLAQSCSSVWAQCGGLGHTGATCCVSGSTCVVLNQYYSQCQPATTTSAGTGGGGTTAAPSITGPVTYTTTDTTTVASHSQAAYPSVSSSSCGAWTLFDNVCCPSYCSNDRLSESCHDGCPCVTPTDSDDCSSSDQYPEVHHVTTNENWHYSRSTHFGLTSGGACGFGLYGLCTRGSATSSWTDPMLGSTCTAFCNAYPQLCKDPSSASNATLRGNFAAPNGNYYTQFWSSLAGLRDNYLSCGECFQVIRTKADGTDYAVGEAGYTDPITLEIVDSCPCSANSKWCCGPEADHCGEISFKYGCPLPAGSIHLDLSDIAMGRLQGGGSLAAGVIPTRYKRVPCPKPGNAYIWLREGGGPYYFALSVVNTAGVGSVTKVEVRSGGQGQWVALQRDPNYTSSRPQERYGAWVLPSGQGPLNVPVGLRVTSPTGEQIVNEAAISSWTPPATAVAGFWYIDLGVQFSVN